MTENEKQHNPRIANRTLAERSDELDDYRTEQLILVCRVGVRSTTGAAILTGLGIARVCDLNGGMVEWYNHNFPLEY